MDTGPAQAQAAARLVVESPGDWPQIRAGVQRTFDQMAAQWDAIATRPTHLDALRTALDRVPVPRRAADLGTGTGRGAELVASRFPECTVVGLDLSAPMLREARARSALPFVQADSSALPMGDASLDLVVALNMLLFVDELARVLAPGGTLAIVYSGAERTPVYVPPDVIRARFDGFAFDEGRTTEGLWLTARRAST